MAKTDNLGDFLKDVADSIRTKTQTTELINAQDFSDKILNISSGENTLKKLVDTRHSAGYLFWNYQGTNVDDLIQYSDTENATDFLYMFSECRALNKVPLLDTRKVISLGYTFSYCQKITTIPLWDTSKVTYMYAMFNQCKSLTNLPPLNTSKVNNMGYMFSGCTSMIEAPTLDTSLVTEAGSMFGGCTKLTTVPAYNMDRCKNLDYMFERCSNLKSILMTNIGVKLDIHYSTKFEREDLLIILNNLKTVTSSKTLTMGATNLAKLTDEDKAIATNKGWTLA